MRTGILIIHGTMGSPHEYGDLHALLSAAGYVPHCIALPAHGDAPEVSLGKTSAAAMLAHCLDEYETLAASCDHVVVMGHSLGGALSLLVAAEHSAHPHRKLRGVIALSAPCEHGIWVNHPQGLFTIPASRWPRALAYSQEGLLPFKSPRFYPWWFPRLRREATWLFALMRDTLPNVTVPVQLAHSPYDMVVPYAEMEKLAARLSNAPELRRRTLGRCGHQIFPRSREKANGADLVLTCLKRWVPVAVPS